MSAYDVAVIGLGAMGSAAAYHCARRGQRVLGLDANPPHHTLGSSHGATRAIRETYFESPDYVPLVQRSYALWRELETATGASLLSTHGAVYVGPPGHAMLEGVVASAERHGLDLERLPRADMAARFPGFALPEGWEGLIEPNGGVLQAELCLGAHADLARGHGADLRFATAAKAWRRTGEGSIVIETEEGELTAGSAIVTVGPWACDLLRDLGLPISGRRIPIVHFDAADPALYDASDMSVYLWATPEGIFAGFPHFPGEGVKIMRHDAGDVCTPETARRSVSQADVAEVANFADTYMPFANGGVRAALVGLYTMTPDNHFVIDRHPAFANLFYATGFSGHGFKFAPVVGEILAEMAVDGKTRHPIGFLGADRFGGKSVTTA
jgi:sarcosine oxidase